jgi:hypothetical protein
MPCSETEYTAGTVCSNQDPDLQTQNGPFTETKRETPRSRERVASHALAMVNRLSIKD